MKVLHVVITALAVSSMLSGPAGAADEAAFKTLAKKKGCFNCHGMDRAILGPSLRDIARRYSGDGGAESRLAGIIKNGSKGGVWGKEAMPAYARLGDGDIKTLVQFILELK